MTAATPPQWRNLKDPRELAGQELLSSGEGALLVLAILWYVIHEADKRVPR